MEEILFACSIVVCVIGVASFVSSIVARAREDGKLTNKVDMALKGIEEIKKSLHQTQTWKEEVIEKLTKHEESINSILGRLDYIESKKKLRRDKIDEKS